MTRIIRPGYYRKFSHRHLEALELRGLLSNLPVMTSPIPGGPQALLPGTVAYSETVPSAGPITSDPANASNVSTSPSQLVITFNQPVNSFDLGLFDIRLDRIGNDGTTTSVFDPSNWPQLIANNNDGLDPTFTTLTISLDTPLTDGHYQIVLVGGSLISSDISNGEWDPFSDYVFSDFTVGVGGLGEERGSPADPVTSSFMSQNPGTMVTGLTDLGSLPSTSAIAPQSIPPVLGKSVATLYRFSIPQGHHWQIGIGARNLNPDGSFSTGLILYRIDQNGNLTPVSLPDPSNGITNLSALGLAYIGLDSGEYCLAVNGTFSDLGSNGEYQLELTATPADQPVQVSDFHLDWVRSGDASPAGLTIQFTGPVNLTGFGAANSATPPLQVVDTSGRVWSVLPFNYDATTNTLTLVFGDRLPAGTYFLKIGKTDGLTDLAGWTPAADGLPSGYLASWTVSPAASSSQRPTLGVVWPQASTPIGRSERLALGTTHSYAFDVIVPGFYKVQSIVTSGAASFQILSSTGRTLLNSTTARPLNTDLIYLGIGSYRLVVTGRQQGGTSMNWTFTAVSLDWELLLDNGVGQWSAQTFGYLNGAGGQNTSGYAGPQTRSASTSIASGNFYGPQQTSTLAPTPLLTPLASAPLGWPTSQNMSVGVVGPAVEDGLVTVASNTQGLLTGIQYASSPQSLVLSVSPSPGLDQSLPPDTAATADLIEATELASINADREVLESTDWILGIGRFVENLLGNSVRGSLRGLESEEGRIQPDGLSLADERIDEGKDLQKRDERASMEFPLGILVTTALACRVKEPIRRWWRKDQRGRGQSSHNHNSTAGNGRLADPRSPSRFGHGPHFGLRRRGAMAARTARSSHEL